MRYPQNPCEETPDVEFIWTLGMGRVELVREFTKGLILT